MRSMPFARKSHCLHLCLRNKVRVLSKSITFYAYHTFIPILSDVQKDLSSVRIKYWNQKYKSRTSLLYGELIGEAAF